MCKAVAIADLFINLRRIQQMQGLRYARLVASLTFANGGPHRATEYAEEVGWHPIIPDFDRTHTQRPAFKFLRHAGRLTNGVEQNLGGKRLGDGMGKMLAVVKVGFVRIRAELINP